MEVECGLEHASLVEGSTYQALSYTWGDPSDTYLIKLNHQPSKVTKNLAIALQHLRKWRTLLLGSHDAASSLSGAPRPAGDAYPFGSAGSRKVVITQGSGQYGRLAQRYSIGNHDVECEESASDGYRFRQSDRVLRETNSRAITRP